MYVSVISDLLYGLGIAPAMNNFANSHDTVILYFAFVNLVRYTMVNGPQSPHFTTTNSTTIVRQIVHKIKFIMNKNLSINNTTTTTPLTATIPVITTK